ncbi:tripartite tricarboxylate transporter substrate binding protein [Amphritea sp. 2_MG-2023]|uniref:Bug family tripartite tricarboxylate transporter substrate binding protein n=1 Tax=Amphritea TaxID=515417 RepID=UPI001C074ABD|nr:MULTISPECIES: tripartite tricarboxylate transporter substrate binding protein [Amphritea]MBU2966765.1 tripartite tricarboxylate transporter substrate binding protein [Amphritea atlantica]MDO6418968.1 tripartite tricarboxylate transporter substrate binding protein [Amphritea sp. 2_MG-2023]
MILSSPKVMIKKTMIKTALILGISSVFTGPVLADYPQRPISLVIPFGTGGPTDISARALARTLSDKVPKPIVIVNQTGGGGAVGSVTVAHARGDGYKMLAARTGSQSVSLAMKSNMPYTLADFKFVGIYELNPVVCVTNSNSGITTMKQLIDLVNSKPKTVSFSSAGVGALQHLAGVMVLNAFGVENPLETAIHLPMNGGGAAATAVLNGTATFECANSSSVAGFIKNGQMTPLMVATKERVEGIDAPTVAELGHPELEKLVGWTGIAGPKSLSNESVDAWEKWLKVTTSDAGFVETMTKLGSQVVYMGPEESFDFIQSQYLDFRTIVEKLDMQIN